MAHRVIRLTAVFLATGALSSSLSSATPPTSASASASHVSVIAAIPSDEPDPRPERLHLVAPSPGPTPTVPPTVIARPAPTMRPIPVPAIDVHEVALINLDTGRFLWQSNAHARWAPASLTKIFTAMVAVDLMGMTATVTVPASIQQLSADSTFMGLTPGERLTVRELLDGVFLASGNDAAATLATAATSPPALIACLNANATALSSR